MNRWSPLVLNLRALTSIDIFSVCFARSEAVIVLDRFTYASRAALTCHPSDNPSALTRWTLIAGPVDVVTRARGLFCVVRSRPSADRQ